MPAKLVPPVTIDFAEEKNIFFASVGRYLSHPMCILPSVNNHRISERSWKMSTYSKRLRGTRWVSIFVPHRKAFMSAQAESRKSCAASVLFREQAPWYISLAQKAGLFLRSAVRRLRAGGALRALASAVPAAYMTAGAAGICHCPEEAALCVLAGFVFSAWMWEAYARSDDEFRRSGRQNPLYPRSRM